MATNERLRTLLDSLGESTSHLAGRVGVDPKTVDRWITQGDRHPHPNIAVRAATLLGVEPTFLWPNLYNRRQAAVVDPAGELIGCYFGPTAVPGDLWTRLLHAATARIDICGDLGLADAVDDLDTLLAAKTTAGVRVRVITCDPIGLAAGIVRTAPLLHTALLRCDHDILTRLAVDGCPAAFAPVLHLRQLPTGTLARVYLSSFDTLWQSATPAEAGRSLRAVAS